LLFRHSISRRPSTRLQTVSRKWRRSQEAGPRQFARCRGLLVVTHLDMSGVVSRVNPADPSTVRPSEGPPEYGISTVVRGSVVVEVTTLGVNPPYRRNNKGPGYYRKQPGPLRARPGFGLCRSSQHRPWRLSGGRRQYPKSRIRLRQRALVMEEHIPRDYGA